MLFLLNWLAGLTDLDKESEAAFAGMTDVSYWDRGRLARIEHRQVRKASSGLALRARSGRDARGPSEELDRTQ